MEVPLEDADRPVIFDGRQTVVEGLEPCFTRPAGNFDPFSGVVISLALGTLTSTSVDDFLVFRPSDIEAR